MPAALTLGLARDLQERRDATFRRRLVQASMFFSFCIARTRGATYGRKSSLTSSGYQVPG